MMAADGSGEDPHKDDGSEEPPLGSTTNMPEGQVANNAFSHENALVVLKGEFPYITRDKLSHIFLEAARQRQSTLDKVIDQQFRMTQKRLKLVDSQFHKSLTGRSIDSETLKISITYNDGTVETFEEWSSCFAESAIDLDPIRAEIVWETVAEGTLYGLHVDLTTEIFLKKEESKFKGAKVAVKVSGPSRDWVRSAYNQLEPILRGARVSKLYRPLEWLRKDWIRGGFTALVLSTPFLFWLKVLVNAPNTPAETASARYHKILAGRGLEQKFDRFVADGFTDHSGINNGGFIALSLAMIFLIILVSFGTAPSKRNPTVFLVPRAAVLIGLSSERYKEYENVFRFLIFSVLVSLIVGVLGSLLAGWLQH